MTDARRMSAWKKGMPDIEYSTLLLGARRDRAHPRIFIGDRFSF